MQIEKYYNDLNTLHINTEENRAYYMPCSDIENARKETNDRKQDLNGEWNFMLFRKILRTEIQTALIKFLYHHVGKLKVMTAINIQIQDIRFRIIRRMFRMTIRAVRM